MLKNYEGEGVRESFSQIVILEFLLDLVLGCNY